MELGQAYSVEQFEADVENVKPRAFDTYVLPAFMIYFAIRSGKPVGKLARRILFTAGVYMAYRSWSQYKTLLTAITGPKEQTEPLTEEV